MPDEHAPPGPGGGEFVSAGNSQPGPPSPNLLRSLPGNESAAAARLQDRTQDSAARAAAHAAAHPAHAPKTPKAHAPHAPVVHAPKAPKSTAPPTFAELQQWEKDAQEGKHLTARQTAALHAAHEAVLAHEAHEAHLAAAKGTWEGTPGNAGPGAAAPRAAEAQRFCLGIAYMPGPDPRIAKGQDGGRDFLTEAELEKAAWSYLINGPQVNAFHMAGTEGCATVVESSIHRGPDWDLGDGIVVRKGTWLVGAILDRQMWQAALDGKVNGWSPEGTARRRKVRKEDAVTIAKSALPDDGDGEEFTELVDANFPTMGLVGKGANGIPRFLVMKDADGDASGLLDPDFVRGLISKSPREAPLPETEAGRTVLPNGIHLSGSPAAMAAFIHAANVRKQSDGDEPGEVEKAKNDTADREKKAASGAAMPDGSYPVASVADLDKAIHAVGRGGASHNAIRKHIITRARSLGASSKIPDNWNSDGSLKGDVSKEADVPQAVAKDLMDMAGDATVLDDGTDGMDPTVPLAAPDGDMDMPGDPADPGSPAWEAIDAATASKWLSILARAKNALCLLAEREMTEAAVADPSDAEHAFSLEDAACAVDYAISCLAVFAAGEQAEAETGAEMAEMCKALAGFDLAPVGVIEGLTAIAKAGRVLSAQNEAAIRAAAESLQKVLASLPEAPVAKEARVARAQAADVAKESSPEEQARNAGPVNPGGTTGMGEPRETGPAAALPADGPQKALPGDVPGRTVVKGALRVAARDMTRRLVLVRADRIRDPAEHFARVAKADDGGDGKVTMQAVFDEEGNLVGIVDPADITPVSGAGGGSDDSADDDAAPAAAAAAPDDMTPQPPADAGTPADAVGKAAQDVTTATPADLGSIIAKAVADALGALPPAQDVAKQADVAAASARADALEARIAKVEETPAAPRVFTNGAVPPAHMLRGQDQGGASTQVDVAKALDRKKQLYGAADAAEQNQVAQEMQGDAIRVLDAIHRR